MKIVAFMLALLLAACAQAPAGRMPQSGTAAPPPQRSAPAPATPDPSAVSRACKVDADCAVKNVGNCCGAHPQCVNINAPVDPQAVKARCAAEHRAGMCNVQAISGCSCVSGQCSNGSGFNPHKSP